LGDLAPPLKKLKFTISEPAPKTPERESDEESNDSDSASDPYASDDDTAEPIFELSQTPEKAALPPSRGRGRGRGRGIPPPHLNSEGIGGKLSYCSIKLFVEKSLSPDLGVAKIPPIQDQDVEALGW
jgi:hypothetical protein